MFTLSREGLRPSRQPMKIDSTFLHDFATRYTAAWCSHDPASVAAFFSPNGSLTINGGAPSVGRAAIAASARAFMTDFPDLNVSFDDLVPKDPRVEFHWTLTGTNSGPGGTDKKVRINGFESWKFSADGLIEESLGRFDAAEYQRQLAHGFSA
jgi:uncharacterized protein (TIGR02246 family)